MKRPVDWAVNLCKKQKAMVATSVQDMIIDLQPDTMSCVEETISGVDSCSYGELRTSL